MRFHMVIPTWKNDAMCAAAIRSLYEYTDYAQYGTLYVLNNAQEPTPELEAARERYGFDLWHSGENLGWMKAINLGFQRDETEAEFFVMCNDDVVFPQDRQFWPRFIELFDKDPHIGGIGPISNYVMGAQHMRAQVDGEIGEVPLLIGFCAAYRSYAFDGAGLLDASLPGGDDLDLSIRLRRNGWKLICDRRNFVYHYGSVTGNRVHSDWDNLQSQHRTMNALIRKHGMKAWYSCVTPSWNQYIGAPLPPKESERLMEETNALGAYIWSKGISVVEGSSTPKELKFLAQQVKGARTACEVGFNMGLSACAMLVGDPDVILVSYDLGEWPCVDYAHQYLEDRFEGRHLLIKGDSTQTFKQPLLPYDFTFIDGGHDEATALTDIMNFAPCSKRVMVDDIRMPGVAAAVEKALSAGLITEPEYYSDTESPNGHRYWLVGNGGAR